MSWRRGCGSGRQGSRGPRQGRSRQASANPAMKSRGGLCKLLGPSHCRLVQALAPQHSRAAPAGHPSIKLLQPHWAGLICAAASAVFSMRPISTLPFPPARDLLYPSLYNTKPTLLLPHPTLTLSSPRCMPTERAVRACCQSLLRTICIVSPLGFSNRTCEPGEEDREHPTTDGRRRHGNGASIWRERASGLALTGSRRSGLTEGWSAYLPGRLTPGTADPLSEGLGER